MFLNLPRFGKSFTPEYLVIETGHRPELSVTGLRKVNIYIYTNEGIVSGFWKILTSETKDCGFMRMFLKVLFSTEFSCWQKELL